MSTKNRKSVPRLFRQNCENNYDDGRASREPTSCAMCCCASCTGFNCPWESRSHIPDWIKLTAKTKRCGICRRDDLNRIYDCDYYTYYKRQRFFVPRKVYRRKKKIDDINEKLDKILKALDGKGQ